MTSRVRFGSRFQGWRSAIAIGLFVKVSRWVKRNLKNEDWRQALREVSGGVLSEKSGYGVVATGSTNAALAPFKHTTLDNQAGKGFPVDSRRYFSINPGNTAAFPRWAREIQPFLANQLSSHTRRAYETDLKQFFSFLDGKMDPHDLNLLRSEHVIFFRKALEEGRLGSRPMAKSTINRKLAVIKSFLQWLRANEAIRDNPAAFVKGFPQTQESSLKGLSDEEAKKILDLPNRNSKAGALHAAILSVLLHLGLRKGELLDLKMGDLDIERGIKVLRVRGKGHRIRILPLTKRVEAELNHYFFVCRRDRQEKETPLFTPTKNPRTKELVKVMHPHAITYLVNRYAKKAGVLKRISPHSCRATCISHALDKRATHRSVQSLAGWSTPLMIQRYDKRREDLNNSAAFLIDYEEEKAAAN